MELLAVGILSQNKHTYLAGERGRLVGELLWWLCPRGPRLDNFTTSSSNGESLSTTVARVPQIWVQHVFRLVSRLHRSSHHRPYQTRSNT